MTAAAAGPASLFLGVGYVTVGVALALALLTVYVLMRARRREWPEVDDVVALVATTTALTAGLRLVVVALTAEQLGPFAPDDRIFIPVAGFALILVSLREIVRVLRRGKDECR